MAESDQKGIFDYLSLLDDDEEDSDDDVNWKRRTSSSSSTPTSKKNNVRNQCVFDDSGDSGLDKKVTPIMRNLNFDEDKSVVGQVNRTVEAKKTSTKVISSVKPSTSKATSIPDSVWRRLSFPDVRIRDSPQPSPSFQRVIFTPSLSIESESESSTSNGSRKTVICTPSTGDSGNIRKRLGPVKSEVIKETPVQQRPPIPDNLDFRPPHFAPTRPKYYSERDIDLNTFVKQIKAEMLFHQSLDRIYNRSMRELPAMKAIPEFQSIIKRVIEGVLFDPEIQLNEETVHRVLRILDIFDLDNTSTWTFLIEKIYTLVTKNTEAHYVRMAKFIEMSFNHMYDKKIRLLPATALSLYKIAQVRPFDPEKKPHFRVKPGTIKADLSAIKDNMQPNS